MMLAWLRETETLASLTNRETNSSFCERWGRIFLITRSFSNPMTP